MRVKAAPILAMSLVLLGGPAFGRTLYVGPQGSDGNTGLDKTRPLHSISAAAAKTLPGDIVQVFDGTYTDPKSATGATVFIGKSGNASHWITYEPYPGAHPIIATQNAPNLPYTVYIDASYIQFIGFEVVGNARYVTLAQAKQIAAAERKAYLASVAQHKANPAVPLVIPHDWSTNDTCIEVSNVTHVVVESNLVHECSATGIAMQEVDYYTIKSNVVFNTSWWSVFDTSGINLHFAHNSDAKTGYKNFVLNNISHDNGNTLPYYDPNFGGNVPTDGNGIIVDTNSRTSDGPPYAARTLIMGNIVYNNGGTGMHAYLSSHVDFFNNTAFLNDSCPVAGSDCGKIVGGQLVSNRSSDVNIYNNILYAPPGVRAYTNYGNSDYSEGHNIIFTRGGQPVGDIYAKDKSDILKDPKFGDSSEIEHFSQSNHYDTLARLYARAATTALLPVTASPARNGGTTSLDNGQPLPHPPVDMDGNQGVRVGIGALSAPSKL